MNKKTAAITIGIICLLTYAPGLRGQLTEDERNTIDIVQRTKNAVVFITNIQYVRDFFSFSSEAVPRGTGSGFVWDNRGHIVTNYHVIEDGDIFNITLPNQEQRQAKLVGREPAKDIAVLRVDGVVILEIPEGSEADRAGLQGLSRDRTGRYYIQDVITAVEGKPVGSYDDLFNVLEDYKVGDVVTLTVRRSDRERRVRIRLVRSD